MNKITAFFKAIYIQNDRFADLVSTYKYISLN